MPIVLVLVTTTSAAASDGLPDSLLRCEEQRLRAESGLVEWSVTDAAGAIGHETSGAERIRFFSSQFAGDTFTRVNRGDENGIVIPGVDGTTGTSVQVPRSQLSADGQIWSYDAGALHARLYMAGGHVGIPPDVRTLGFAAAPLMRPLHADDWAAGRPLHDAKFQERVDGALRVVRAEMPDKRAFEWWIDPQKGWSIGRAVAYDEGGRVLHESRSDVRQFDGVWLAAETKFYSSSFQGGEKPLKVVRVHAAEINRPDQPTRLTPGHIGIEAGTNVELIDSRSLRATEVQFWDGTTLVCQDEWRERLRTGNAQLGPAFQREFARARAGMWKASPDRRLSDDWADTNAIAIAPAAPTSQPESAWAKYTREFIAKYALDDDQSQRAWSICRECEQARERYLETHSRDFEELKRAEAQAAAAGTRSVAAELAALAKRREKLERPINVIFEEQLKPRLEKLPTRAQRMRAAESDKP